MGDLESALTTALEQMPREIVEQIIRKVLDAHPVPDPLPRQAMILYHANPSNYLYQGFRARFSFKCIAGNRHEETAENLWVGKNHESEIRNVICNCGNTSQTPVKFGRPK